MQLVGIDPAAAIRVACNLLRAGKLTNRLTNLSHIRCRAKAMAESCPRIDGQILCDHDPLPPHPALLNNPASRLYIFPAHQIMASSTNRTVVLAPVQRWNASTVSIQCPFCTKIHTHGFGSGYDSVFRAPHCNHHLSPSFPSYRFAYPFSTCEGSVAYEIDKTNGYFVAFGAKALQSEAELLGKALDGLSLDVSRSPDSKSWKEATEMITIGLEDRIFRRLHEYFGGEDAFALKRLDHVKSRMITFGDSEYVDNYLRTSPEANLFLFGSNEEGKSALSLAACEKYSAVTKLLLDHGARPDHQDNEGRTPLMEAALWGRIENVKCLLEYGANRKLRDIHCHRAVDLAGPSLQNDEERYHRSGGEDQVYRENTFIANQARRVIFELLKDTEELPYREISAHNRTFESHFFKHTSRGTIELIAPIAEFHVRNQWKTIASLQRPWAFPSVAAMSGWSHGETKVTVSGKEWTTEVLRISSIVGHRLPEEKGLDQAKEGQYFATHAEKQLIAYFIDKHVLIETEDDKLLRAKPPVLMKQATILVSRPPCGDCLQFIETVNTALGLMISVLDRS